MVASATSGRSTTSSTPWRPAPRRRCSALMTSTTTIVTLRPATHWARGPGGPARRARQVARVDDGHRWLRPAHPTAKPPVLPPMSTTSRGCRPPNTGSSASHTSDVRVAPRWRSAGFTPRTWFHPRLLRRGPTHAPVSLSPPASPIGKAVAVLTWGTVQGPTTTARNRVGLPHQVVGLALGDGAGRPGLGSSPVCRLPERRNWALGELRATSWRAAPSVLRWRRRVPVGTRTSEQGGRGAQGFRRGRTRSGSSTLARGDRLAEGPAARAREGGGGWGVRVHLDLLDPRRPDPTTDPGTRRGRGNEVVLAVFEHLFEHGRGYNRPRTARRGATRPAPRCRRRGRRGTARAQRRTAVSPGRRLQKAGRRGATGDHGRPRRPATRPGRRAGTVTAGWCAGSPGSRRPPGRRRRSAPCVPTVALAQEGDRTTERQGHHDEHRDRHGTKAGAPPRSRPSALQPTRRPARRRTPASAEPSGPSSRRPRPTTRWSRRSPLPARWGSSALSSESAASRRTQPQGLGMTTEHPRSAGSAPTTQRVAGSAGDRRPARRGAHRSAGSRGARLRGRGVANSPPFRRRRSARADPHHSGPTGSTPRRSLTVGIGAAPGATTPEFVREHGAGDRGVPDRAPATRADVPRLVAAPLRRRVGRSQPPVGGLLDDVRRASLLTGRPRSRSSDGDLAQPGLPRSAAPQRRARRGRGEYTVRRYLDDPPTCSRAGRRRDLAGARAVGRRPGPGGARGGASSSPATPRTVDWLAALVAHPRAIQRPIITAADGTTVGADEPRCAG